MSRKISDAKSRELILTDLDTTFLVEAAAGTGKTTSIVGRMVNLIATGKCKIENLAAATFTRKAAAELRERFHTRMRSEVSSDRTKVEVERLKTAIDRIEYAFVGTFHSFCSTLLRERPIECGVEPGFRELDEAEDAQIREQAWQTFLSDLYSKQGGQLDQIQELGLKTNDLKHCFNRFVLFPDVQDWPHAAPPAIDLAAIKTMVRSYIEDMQAISIHFPTDRKTDSLMGRYENIVRAVRNADWEVTGEFFDLLELFDTSDGATLKYWHDPKVAKIQRDHFRDFRESTVKPALDWWYRHRYEFVIKLLEQASAIYDRLRRASGGLDYQDLLLCTAEALKTQPKLRAYFQRRFTHLLVDEFQDTDPIQAEVLAYLTSSNLDEQVWQKCVPQRGSLFLVGDPKQSIYRFRRADIVTYKQVKTIFENAGGRVLTLARNFRSVSGLRTWANGVFGDLFGEKETIYSPVAVDMEQGRNDATSGELSGASRLPIPGDYRRPEAVEFEADFIAGYIYNSIALKKTVSRTQAELDRGRTECVEPGDFLIVARNKWFLHTYAEALDRYGINNEVTGSNAFQNIAEINVMLDCLRAVDDPQNPIPYVSILRGKLFGFGDAELYELKKAGGRFSYNAPLPEGLGAELKQRFDDVNHRLTTYRFWLRNLPFAAAFSKIASDLGLLARCSSHEDGDIIAGGFLKSVELLRAESWNFDSANDVITYLENILSSSEADTCSVLPQSGSNVRIMNLHKVKGLEAPIVFLANTFGVYTGDPDFHVDRSGETTKGYLSITKPKGEYQTAPMAIPSYWERFKKEEGLYSAAEETRLLYVACTRAACQLVISQASKKKAAASTWGPLHEYVEELPELVLTKTKNKLSAKAAPPLMTTFADAEQQISQSWQTASEPTYQVVAAKQFAMKQGSHRPTWRASGDYGHQWGTAIHRLLEIKLEQPDSSLDHLALQLAQQFDLGSNRVPEMLGVVQSVTLSDIWDRARRAKKSYTEIPFEKCTDTETIPTIVRGVIDLCFEEQGGWVIVDYKTDDIQDSDLKSAMELYRPQLKTYADFWQDLTGQPVVEMGLYFTKLDRYCVLL